MVDGRCSFCETQEEGIWCPICEGTGVDPADAEWDQILTEGADLFQCDTCSEVRFHGVCPACEPDLHAETLIFAKNLKKRLTPLKERIVIFTGRGVDFADLQDKIDSLEVFLMAERSQTTTNLETLIGIVTKRIHLYEFATQTVIMVGQRYEKLRQEGEIAGVAELIAQAQEAYDNRQFKKALARALQVGDLIKQGHHRDR